MLWFKTKVTCVHCKSKTTRREFEGQPTCADCKTRVLMDREGTRTCPVDGSALVKEHKGEIIMDRCPTCDGVWLDAGEIEAIKSAAESSGIAVGMVCF